MPINLLISFLRIVLILGYDLVHHLVFTFLHVFRDLRLLDQDGYDGLLGGRLVHVLNHT